MKNLVNKNMDAKSTGAKYVAAKTKTSNKSGKKQTSKSTMKSVSKSQKQPSEMEYSIEEVLKKVSPTPLSNLILPDDEKIDIIAEKFHDIMIALGLDMTHESLEKTPRRIAKMYVNEVFAGLSTKNFPSVSVLHNEMKYDQMVVVQNIKVLSVCEHHFQTIDGFATVAYIPKDNVIGLSKINRVVEFFSRRPQVQERLTKQIADCLQYVLDTEHIGVYINAKHYCVVARGIEDATSTTSTSDLRGHFKTLPETREEFLRHCKTQI